MYYFITMNVFTLEQARWCRFVSLLYARVLLIYLVCSELGSGSLIWVITCAVPVTSCVHESHPLQRLPDSYDYIGVVGRIAFSYGQLRWNKRDSRERTHLPFVLWYYRSPTMAKAAGQIGMSTLRA